MINSGELSGVVLSREQTGGRFLRIRLFSAELGLSGALFPISSQKKINPPAPDFLDEVECLFNNKKSENSIPFIREFETIESYRDLATYPLLFMTASEIARFYLNNGSHLLDPGPQFKLLRSSLDSFRRARVPNVVLLKVYYCFARNEGLPVRESWLFGLPKPLYNDVVTILGQPVDQANIEQSKINDIMESLKIWMNGETELHHR